MGSLLMVLFAAIAAALGPHDQNNFINPRQETLPVEPTIILTEPTVTGPLLTDFPTTNPFETSSAPDATYASTTLLIVSDDTSMIISSNSDATQSTSTLLDSSASETTSADVPTNTDEGDDSGSTYTRAVNVAALLVGFALAV